MPPKDTPQDEAGATAPEPSTKLEDLSPETIQRLVDRLPRVARRLRKSARRLGKRDEVNEGLIKTISADARACTVAHAKLQQLQADFVKLSRAARGEGDET